MPMKARREGEAAVVMGSVDGYLADLGLDRRN